MWAMEVEVEEARGGNKIRIFALAFFCFCCSGDSNPVRPLFPVMLQPFDLVNKYIHT